MFDIIVVTAGLAVLLGLERRYRWRIVRAGTAFLAVPMLRLVRPDVTVATRMAFTTPPAERVQDRFGYPISEYESGVRTTASAMERQARSTQPFRPISYAVLLWLACSPVLSRNSDETIDDQTIRPS